jgi:hypothetical protein
VRKLLLAYRFASEKLLDPENQVGSFCVRSFSMEALNKLKYVENVPLRRKLLT